MCDKLFSRSTQGSLPKSWQSDYRKLDIFISIHVFQSPNCSIVRVSYTILFHGKHIHTSWQIHQGHRGRLKFRYRHLFVRTRVVGLGRFTHDLKAKSERDLKVFCSWNSVLTYQRHTKRKGKVTRLNRQLSNRKISKWTLRLQLACGNRCAADRAFFWGH